MLLKILSTITLVVPIIKGVQKIWQNNESGTAEKIAETITIVIPLIVGISSTWKKES